MVKYWERQHVFDVLTAAVVAVASVEAPRLGVPVLITLTSDSLASAARAWVGPALTLLGMMSATTAFIFSVVDRSEFKALRELGVESQLWRVFSENIMWLTVAAISAMVFSFRQGPLTDMFLMIASFVFFMSVICVLKFAWVMRQIISVRASR